ncbi:M20/M25/M40 family metallo-hydrolase [Lacrimispora sp.]|uniref:M20/M25/M40 family metallo-hydrolase n=1 Tax=Lacrimispora sp. TaxID=2719234 RepID=UPI0039947007
MISKEVKQYIKEQEEEAYELLKTLAQIPSPSNHEEKRMEFCKKWLEDAGAKGVYTDEALNVVYPYGVTESNPVVVIMAHMDVVFPDTQPLPFKEEAGRLYCPGIGDDTANLVNILLTARYLTQNHIFPKEVGLVFVCNSGEEGLGNLKGSKKICQTYKGRIREFYSMDGGLGGVVNRAVGSSRFKVTVKTEGGHSYGSFGNANAIEKLSGLIQEIYQIQVPLEGKTTYNVGTIEGGTSVNTIAQEASMLCEFRSDSKESLLYMEEKFKEIFDKDGVTVEVIGIRPCENLNEEQSAKREALLVRAEELLYRVTGKKPDRHPGSTDCNIPLSLGIPSVCYGTYYGKGAHTREEYVEKDSLSMGYEVAFETVLNYTV